MRKIFEKLLLVMSIAALAIACQFERTTHIYGKVVDQDQQPVDSVLIVVSGSNLSPNTLDLASTYTDANGDYEVLLEVPKKYLTLSLSIPYDGLHNPKYSNYTLKSQTKGSNPLIGKKTQWDFQLEVK
nr:hypothetical protein [uncultured Dyadobacter sp.]